MSLIARVLIALVLALMVGLPVVGARSGWGLGSQTDASIVAESDEFCPSGQRRPDGTCRRSVRSYYFGRGFVGGGPRSGK